MRFRLVCAIAVILPIASEATARITSICCHSAISCGTPSASTSMRMMKAKDASFGAVPINSVTAVGAPW